MLIYRYFFTFLLSVVITCIYLIVLSFYHVFEYHKTTKDISFAKSLRHTPVSFFLAIYAIIAGLYPLALLIYHLFLNFMGQTAHEWLRSSRSQSQTKQVNYRPFDEGKLWKNYIKGLCRPKGVNFLQPRQYYIEGDRRFENFEKDPTD